MEDGYLTTKQVCELLNIHPNTLYRHDIPCVKIGRVKRYKRTEVEAHIAEASKTPITRAGDERSRDGGGSSQ